MDQKDQQSWQHALSYFPLGSIESIEKLHFTLHLSLILIKSSSKNISNRFFFFDIHTDNNIYHKLSLFYQIPVAFSEQNVKLF